MIAAGRGLASRAARRAALASVFLIGLDGADWARIDPLVKAGRMPRLARLLETGTRGVLRSPEFHLSPRVWASVATGKTVGKHGVAGFLDGGRRLSSSDRRSAALWDILTLSGRSVACVGWMTTWPAEAVNGVMVSDLYFSPNAPEPAAHPPGLRLSVTRAWRRDLSRRARKRLFRRFGPFALPAPCPRDRPEEECPLEQALLDRRLLWVSERDEGFVRVAEEVLARKGGYDLFLTHLWGADFTGHGFWRFEPPHRFANVIADYYAFLDAALGRVLRFAKPGDTVLVVSDHGMRARTPADGTEHPRLSGAHAEEGIFVAAGPGIAPGRLERPVADADVAPTVLRLLGLPQAEDMDGRPVEGVPAKAGSLPPIPSYDLFWRPGEAAPDDPMTAEEHERLRASGYIP